MPDGMSPSQFQILREDIRAVNLRLDNLVSRETFTDERRRVDARIDSQGKELAELKQELASEAQVRIQQNQTDAVAKLNEAREREKIRRQSSWQWFALAVSLIGGPAVAIMIATAMSRIGLGG